MSEEKLAAEPLVIRRTYNAPPETVFRAWTEPEQLKQWFSPSAEIANPFVEVDLRVGGRYRIGFQASGSEIVNVVSGVYREIIPPKKLVYTWNWESPHEFHFDGHETQVTVEFHEKDGGTELVMTHEGIPTQHMQEMHNQGWTGALDRLDEHL